MGSETLPMKSDPSYCSSSFFSAAAAVKSDNFGSKRQYLTAQRKDALLSQELSVQQITFLLPFALQRLQNALVHLLRAQVLVLSASDMVMKVQCMQLTCRQRERIAPLLDHLTARTSKFAVPSPPGQLLSVWLLCLQRWPVRRPGTQVRSARRRLTAAAGFPSITVLPKCMRD
eukprot:6191963-Pleurochrysis_carterae.AAC.6